MALLSTEQAVKLAQRRKVLPTALDTAGIREEFSAAVRRRSVFSAETTHGGYLEAINRTLQKVMAGDYDIPTARQVLRRALKRAGWTEDKGFPGDAPKDGPAVGIKRLDSEARLNLILETQIGLLTNAARKAREMEPDRVAMFPAYQLVRIGAVEVPRDWLTRWGAVAGRGTNGKVLMAPKWHPVWERLGDSVLFPDGLDSQNPPYAFNSEMGWREVTAARAEKMLPKFKLPKEIRLALLPDAKASIEALPPATVERLQKTLAAETKGKTVTLQSTLSAILKRQAASEERRASRKK